MCYGTVLSESLAKAAKAHRCDQCFRAIMQGERYYKQTGVFDGHFESLRFCQTCAVALPLDAEDGCYVTPSGLDEVREVAKNHGWKRIRAGIKKLRERLTRKR